MKKFKTLILLISIMASAVMFASCSKDDEKHFSLYIYGVGNEDITYDISVSEFHQSKETGRIGGYGSWYYGACKNLANDIAGQYISDSRIFVIEGLSSYKSQGIVVTINDGDSSIKFDIPTIRNTIGEDKWINVSYYIPTDF